MISGERLIEASRWIHKKKIGLAAGAVLTIAAAACGGKAKGDVVVSSPEPNIPQAAATPDIPKPAPTPEKPAFKFNHYDVFAGDIEGGGKLIVAILADPADLGKGRTVLIAEKRTPTCDNGYYEFVYAASGSYNQAEINYRARTRRIAGALLNQTTVSGTISEEGYRANSPSGPVNCPANSFKFTATLVGNGRERLIGAYRTALGSLASGATDQQLQASVERQCVCTLP